MDHKNGQNKATVFDKCREGRKSYCRLKRFSTTTMKYVSAFTSTNLRFAELRGGRPPPLIQQQITGTPFEDQHPFRHRTPSQKRPHRIRTRLSQMLTLAGGQFRMRHRLFRSSGGGSEAPLGRGVFFDRLLLGLLQLRRHHCGGAGFVHHVAVFQCVEQTFLFDVHLKHNNQSWLNSSLLRETLLNNTLVLCLCVCGMC